MGGVCPPLRAHPRSRGEHWSWSVFLPVRLGSSPLARGTRGRGHREPGRGGLIPARAGNTHRQRQQAPRRRAHPRSRGEHASCTVAMSPAAGSSPLARGTPAVRAGVGLGGGLIPARAGNTGGVRKLPPPGGAHPRSRGEHVIPVLVQIGQAGSSPLARGTQRGVVPGRSIRGLIPARAGNTGRPTL